MSAAFALALHHADKPESIEKIAPYQYRVRLKSGHNQKQESYIGVGYDWITESDGQPFGHLPYNAFLALSVFRHELFKHPDVTATKVQGYMPNRKADHHWVIRTIEDKLYDGFLFDWRHLISRELISDIAFQAGLSYYLLSWMCSIREMENESKMEHEFFHERMGVLHSGDRRSGKNGLYEQGRFGGVEANPSWGYGSWADRLGIRRRPKGD